MTAFVPEPIEILMIEDNPGDANLTRIALHEGKVRNRLHVCADGEEGLAFLRREGRYKDAARPDLILLDLNLPRRSGLEVLADVKADASLADIPIVILTTSDAERDVVATYRLHANCYIVKPVDLPQFMSVVRSIESFWLEVVKLPADGG